MDGRGRISSASLELATVAPVEVVERQKPPHDLSDEECEVWVAVVGSVPADWFAPSNTPLLVQYCRHCVHARRIAEALERVTSDKRMNWDQYDRLLKMQERESRIIIMLATKMKLTQQATTNIRGDRRASGTRKPWE